MRLHFLLPQGRTKVELAGLYCGIQLQHRMIVMVCPFLFLFLKLSNTLGVANGRPQDDNTKRGPPTNRLTWTIIGVAALLLGWRWME